MNWFNFYADFINNLFCFLSLDLYVNFFAACKDKKQQFPFKILYLCEIILVSFIPEIPFYDIISLLVDFTYIFFITKGILQTRFLIFIKYEAYFYISLFMITFLHSMLTQDNSIYFSNTIYAEYTSRAAAAYQETNRRIT